MSYQQLTIFGNIGKMEQRFTPQGDSVVNFSVAVSDRYKKKDGTQVDETEWFNCVSWGKQSEVINQYFQKGSRIMLTGKLKTRQWQDKEGATRYNTDVKVDSFSFVDKLSESKPSQESTNQAQQGYAPQHQQNQQATKPTNQESFEYTSDDIPFR